MSKDFTNRDSTESRPHPNQPLPVRDVNPYMSPQIDLTPASTSAHQTNTANDLATATLMMALNVIGALATVPFVIVFVNATPQSMPMPWVFWLVTQLVSCGFMGAITIPIGVWLGSRVGLEAPVFRGLAKGDFAVLNQMRSGWIAASVVGIAVGTIAFLADRMLPAEVTSSGMNQDALKTIEATPAWIRILSSLGTGITEETWCRYGFMAFIVWVGVAITRSERPSTAYFWFANILASLPLAAMYVFNHLVLGGSANPENMAYLVGFNSLIALPCGWLYWKYGIESAIASHTIGDIVMRLALPFVAKLLM